MGQTESRDIEAENDIENGSAVQGHSGRTLRSYWDSSSDDSDDEDDPRLVERRRQLRLQRPQNEGNNGDGYPGAASNPSDRIIAGVFGVAPNNRNNNNPQVAPQPQQPAAPAMRRLVSRPPKIHATPSVQSDVSIHKDSLRMVPVSAEEMEDIAPSTQNDSGAADDNKEELTQPANRYYQIRFTFDALEKCKISLFFMAQERRDDCNHLIGFTSRYEVANSSVQFEPGLGQEYVQSATRPIDIIELLKAGSPDYDPAAMPLIVPVVVIIEPETPRAFKVTAQTVFATLLKCADETYAIKPVKVKIEYCRNAYIVHDVYGLDESAMGKECVVCMCEARDTIALPCRHLCLCQGCAEVLRYQTTKCPICRSQFESLLRIETVEESKSIEAAEEPIQDEKRNSKEKEKEIETVVENTEMERERDMREMEIELDEMEMDDLALEREIMAIALANEKKKQEANKKQKKKQDKANEKKKKAQVKKNKKHTKKSHIKRSKSEERATLLSKREEGEGEREERKEDSGTPTTERFEQISLDEEADTAEAMPMLAATPTFPSTTNTD